MLLIALLNIVSEAKRTFLVFILKWMKDQKEVSLRLNTMKITNNLTIGLITQVLKLNTTISLLFSQVIMDFNLKIVDN